MQKLILPWKVLIMKKAVKILLLIVILVAANVFVLGMVVPTNPQAILRVNVTHTVKESFQIFYSADGTFSEEESRYYEYDPSQVQGMTLEIPVDEMYPYWRLDLGSTPADTEVLSVELVAGNVSVPVDLERIFAGRNFEPTSVVFQNNSLKFSHNHPDPFFVFEITEHDHRELQEESRMSALPGILLSCGLVTAVIFVLVKWRQTVYRLTKTLTDSRMLLWSLAKNDFKTKYAGSALGIVWAFVQPVVTILVYWMVFEFGLRSSSPVEGTPFIIWFISGMIPWFFFSEALNNATNCFIEYTYLVKKVVFKISILPLVKILSSFFVHAVFLGFVLVLCIAYHTLTGLEILQLFYYLVCLTAFVVSLSFITSAFMVFLKDFGQIINIVLQIGMWATPIVWSSTIVPEKYQFILKLNPLFYIVEGYRDAFICNGVWFWNKGFQTIYFWSLTALIFVIGAGIFRRTKPHFADVL